MFHPTDKELLDTMLGGDTKSADLLKEYMRMWRVLSLVGVHGPLKAHALATIIMKLDLEPPEMGITASKDINWREIEEGAPVRHTEDERTGEFVQLVSQGSIAVRFEGQTEIEEVYARHLELGPPRMPQEIDQEYVQNEVGERPLELAQPDWEKAKKGDPLYAMVDGDMFDAVLKTRTPKGKCTVDIDGEEKIVPREQVFLPV